MSGTYGHRTPDAFRETEAALASDRVGRLIAALSISAACLIAGMVWLAYPSVPSYERTDDVRFADSSTYTRAGAPYESSAPLLVEARFAEHARPIPAGAPAQVQFTPKGGPSLVVNAEVVQRPPGSALVPLRITDALFWPRPSAVPVSARVVVAHHSPLARLVGNAIP